MEMKNQVNSDYHTPVEKATNILWMGCWVGPQAIINMVVKSIIPTAPARN
jgi:hypothetical protein